MSDATDVEPEELVSAGQKLIGVAEDQFLAISDARGAIYVDHSNFGKYTTCGEAARSHHEAIQAAGRAVERMTTAMEKESDDLIRSGFAYQDFDDAAEAGINGAAEDTPSATG